MTVLYYTTVCLKDIWEKELICDRIHMVRTNITCQIKAEAKLKGSPWKDKTCQISREGSMKDLQKHNTEQKWGCRELDTRPFLGNGCVFVQSAPGMKDWKFLCLVVDDTCSKCTHGHPRIIGNFCVSGGSLSSFISLLLFCITWGESLTVF